MSKDNIFTMTFSEPVVFINLTLVQKSIKVYINGPSSPYKFESEIYDPKNYLATTNQITQLDVRIYDVQAALYGLGVEKGEIWFTDLTVLKDLANNNFSDGKMVGNMRTYEYISTSKLN